MGCDIHIQIERRVSGVWQRVDWRDTWRWATDGYWDPSAGVLLMPEDFDSRNYNLFGVLADVRNGTWGDEVTPIVAPRGLPSDMAALAPSKYADEEPWLGDHSMSWVSLKELQDYNWKAPLKMRAWVSHEAADKFRADGIPPTSYSAGGNHGEYIEWMSTVGERVRSWHHVCLPFLAMLGAPDDVRIVFGFDN